MGLTKHPDKPKGECVMEFRDKPMQNLIRIKEKEICKNVQELLLDGEQIVGAYKTVRDQAVFTTHRIFMVDMQGMTGTRQEIFVLPYRKILHYGIKTAGFGDPLQTSELTVCFADEHEAKFGFIGQDELLAVARAISRCILYQNKRKTPAPASDPGAGVLHCCNMRKKENVEGSAGDAISAAGLEHVVQEAGDISRVGDRDVKALGGSVHHLEQLGGGVVLFQVAGLAIVQVQEHTAAAGGYLLHETVFIKILDAKHKNTSHKEMFYSGRVPRARLPKRDASREPDQAAPGVVFRPLRCYTVLAGSDEIIPRNWHDR